MNKVIVPHGQYCGCAYLTELFIALYGQNPRIMAFFQNRGNLQPYGWSYYLMMFCNVVSPQLFGAAKLQEHYRNLLLRSIIVNIGMWFGAFCNYCNLNLP